jgi:hypothetical protein
MTGIAEHWIEPCIWTFHCAGMALCLANEYNSCLESLVHGHSRQFSRGAKIPTHMASKREVPNEEEPENHDRAKKMVETAGAWVARPRDLGGI